MTTFGCRQHKRKLYYGKNAWYDLVCDRWIEDTTNNEHFHRHQEQAYYHYFVNLEVYNRPADLDCLEYANELKEYYKKNYHIDIDTYGRK